MAILTMVSTDFMLDLVLISSFSFLVECAYLIPLRPLISCWLKYLLLDAYLGESVITDLKTISYLNVSGFEWYLLFLAAKNLALAGVKSVTLHDEEAVGYWDLSSNFFFSEDDIGKNRAEACVQKLQELNSAVLISALTEKLSKERLSNFQVCFLHNV